MRRVEEILTDYRTRDTHGRLSLYLEHPYLRELFTELERRETEAAVKPEPRPGPGLAARLKTALRPRPVPKPATGDGRCC